MSSTIGAPCMQLAGLDGMVLMMDYVRGPTFGCYVGCKFGLNSAGIDAYTDAMMIKIGGGGDSEAPHANIFYPRAIAYAQQLCTSCPLSACEMLERRQRMISSQGACVGGCGLSHVPFTRMRLPMRAAHQTEQRMHRTVRSFPPKRVGDERL